MPKKKPSSKKVIDVATDVAVAAMTGRMWEQHKPEEIADFALAVAVKIVTWEPAVTS